MPAAPLVDAERFVRPGTCLRTDSLSQKTRSRGPEPRYERRSSDRPCVRSLVWRYHLRAVDLPVGGCAFRIGAENPRDLRCSQRNECIAKEMSKVPGSTRPFRRRRTPQSFSQRRRGRRGVHWGYSRNRGPLQASRGARFRHVRVLRPADWPAAAFAPRSPRRWTLLWLPANGARRAIGRSLQTVLAGFEPAILRLDGRVDSDHGRRRTR